MPIVKCDKCGKEFEVKERTIREKKYSSNPNQWLCRSCKLIGTGSEKKTAALKKRWANATEEQRKQWTSGILAECSEEERNRRIEKQKETFKTMSPEKREAMLKKKSEYKKRWYKETDPKFIADMNRRIGETIKQQFADHPEWKQRHSIIMKEWWNSLSDENIKVYKDIRRVAWQNISDERKAERSRLLSEKQKLRWKNMDRAERDRIIKTLRDAYDNWFTNLSDEEKMIYNSRLQRDHERWQNNVSSERKEEIYSRVSATMKKVWSNKTDDEIFEWERRWIEGMRNKTLSPDTTTESDFMNILNRIGANYEIHWFNEIKHPEFDSLFKNNPIKNSLFTIPYHQWDFKINSLNNTILIDIDGSIHDPSKTDYDIATRSYGKVSLKDITEFNDSKRPYQTDGYNAYIIQCFDDVLTDSNPVINVVTGEKMTVNELMALIKLAVSDDYEIKQIIKEL